MWPTFELRALLLGRGHRVMAQTSLGEAIRPTGRREPEAHAALNARRLDFAIFDRRGMIVRPVEYQGTGHCQGAAASSARRCGRRRSG